MQFSKSQKIILAGGGFLIIVVLVLIFTNTKGGGNVLSANLTVWGVDDASVITPLLSGYTQLQPGVKINYVKVDSDKYDSKLLEALALAKGPDVFVVRSGSLLKDKAKLAPVGSTQFNLAKIRENFPEVVWNQLKGSDFVYKNQIYALPLYIDTLTLFYNRDMFNESAVVYPPKTWEDFQNIIPLLRKTDELGNITQAGAALGGTDKTIGAAGDILSLLMLQNGVVMTSADLGNAVFSSEGTRGGASQALNFYTQFASPASKYYTWNDEMGNALNSFASGKVAMVLGYKNDLITIKKKNPFLNMGVAPAPQVDPDKVLTYANYFGLGVSARSKSQLAAWDFVIYATTNLDFQRAYIKSTQKSPALKSLIAEMVNSLDMQVFVRQALTAQSWVRVDNEQARQIFSDAIDDVLSGRSDSSTALQRAQQKVSQLLKDRAGK